MKKILVVGGVVLLVALVGRGYWAYQQMIAEKETSQNNIVITNSDQQLSSTTIKTENQGNWYNLWHQGVSPEEVRNAFLKSSGGGVITEYDEQITMQNGILYDVHFYFYPYGESSALVDRIEIYRRYSSNVEPKLIQTIRDYRGNANIPVPGTNEIPFIEGYRGPQGESKSSVSFVDLDEDGFLDLVIKSDQGNATGNYHYYLFDPMMDRFLCPSLTPVDSSSIPDCWFSKDSSGTVVDAGSSFFLRKHVGYIKKIYEVGGRVFADIDYAEVITGKEYEKIQPDFGPGFLIQNKNQDILSLKVQNNIKIRLATLSYFPNTVISGEAGKSESHVISQEIFMKIYATSENDHYRNAPYWILVSPEKEIVLIEEIPIP